MGITPEENILVLERIQAKASTAAAPVANGFADMLRAQTANLTLKEVSHGEGVFYRNPAGRPPAYVSGALARSLTATYGNSPAVSESSVWSALKYAAVQEFGTAALGGPIYPNFHKYMHWVNTGGSWYMKSVDIPPHPYLKPTVQRLIIDGSFSRSAVSDFMMHMSPVF